MLVRHNARHSPRPSMKCREGGVPHRPFAGHHGAKRRGSPTLTSAGFDMMGMIASASDQFISAGYCLTGESVRPCAPVSVSDLKVNHQHQVALQMLAGQKPGFRWRTAGGGPAPYRR
jgi:hypothetical protein